jgi:hypothetical protein
VPTPPRTVREVAREIVGEVAPDQVGEFAFVAQRYAQAPGAAERAGRPSNEPTASMIDLGGHALGVIALGVTTDVCKDLLVHGVKQARQGGWGRLRRLFRRDRPELDRPVPPLTEEQAPVVHQQVRSAVLATGADAALADSVATALVRSWPRSTS